jgi:hypothetical protein
MKMQAHMIVRTVAAALILSTPVVLFAKGPLTHQMMDSVSEFVVQCEYSKAASEAIRTLNLTERTYGRDHMNVPNEPTGATI